MLKTHLSIHTATPTEPHFTLTQLAPISTNVEVRRYPLRVIAWDLMEGEQVSVHIAKVQALSNPHWALSEDECPCVLEPGQLANTKHQPYKRHGQAVVLTAENATACLDDAGTYFFEYHGSGQVILDCYDDPVPRKP